MNFARDYVDAAPSDRLALIERPRSGGRIEWSFGGVSRHSAALAGTFASHGVGRGDVVMCMIGNRPDWVLSMLACFRIGAVVLPCNEQLRAKDLKLRMEMARPRLIVADERNRAELEAAGADGDAIPVLLTPDEALFASPPARAVDLSPEEPCLMTFTSGTSGPPKCVVHAQRYLTGQRLQAEHWLAPDAGGLVWCTAASGWSKSARNVFIAPWLRGASALLHDARFDPFERLAVLREEQVNVLCMAPTEYRVIAKRASIEPLPELRGLVAAGEALNPEVLEVWKAATGLAIRDGYGQTETGQLTGTPLDSEPRLGSMGLPLPGVKLSIDGGELVADPASVPTFFKGYLGEGDDAAGSRRGGDTRTWPEVDRSSSWRTGDRVREDEDGYLYFEGRADDVIISSGYRIGPFEVESALVSHPAVAEAAVVAAPDEERGSVVRGVIVLRDGYAPEQSLARELQEHVKRQTAPYKYPRVIDFVEALPKTSSGKVMRATLRAETEPLDGAGD